MKLNKLFEGIDAFQNLESKSTRAHKILLRKKIDSINKELSIVNLKTSALYLQKNTEFLNRMKSVSMETAISWWTSPEYKEYLDSKEYIKYKHLTNIKSRLEVELEFL